MKLNYVKLKLYFTLNNCFHLLLYSVIGCLTSDSFLVHRELLGSSCHRFTPDTKSRLLQSVCEVPTHPLTPTHRQPLTFAISKKKGIHKKDRVKRELIT